MWGEVEGWVGGGGGGAGTAWNTKKLQVLAPALLKPAHD